MKFGDFWESERRVLYGKERGSESIEKLVLFAATRKFVQENGFPTGERKWITIDANPSPRKGLRAHISKVFTKMVRHHDRDEREHNTDHITC